jgi:imidazolonepropionase-like amidohydrolase
MEEQLRNPSQELSDKDGASAGVTYILADLLIPGKGEPASDQAVICQAGKIVYVGSPSTIPSEFSNAVPIRVPYLLPGLWDCHSHFMGLAPEKAINVLNLFATAPAEAAARATRQVRDTLYAGFTSCVELGGYGIDLEPVIGEGSILGPTIYGAGAALSMTAGHGDVFE